ncbi:POT family proton-dependent oligopeptide transporter [Blastomyces parvus]|uniref:POT family proton-dependent oligopeptide transporter n=1 Tax=Blastomyces parvus TaxID=2060905 RepID=A0A2B7WX86_9EURO|nr:POT family proton-dependent oligopeptide transporter [Blastomyces parvus]
MATSNDVEVQNAAGSGLDDKGAVAGNNEKSVGAAVYTSDHGSLEDINRQAPTEDEQQTLRRVPDKIPWLAFSIAFVELCERFSYYGTIVVFVNFIQREMPEGSTTGAGGTHRTPGALGLGQRASTGLTLFNSFWSYIMPLAGAYVADEHLGRFKTIMYSIAVALVGHTVLIISAIPPVLKNPNGAVACFAVGLIIMGVGTGGFKSNISPLIAEQYTEEFMFIKTTKKGERVIVDPAVTVSRIYHYFYLMINIGALVGQIAMVYAEKYVGFYLSFLLPTIMFCFCPLVLFLLRNKYSRRKPVGSVYSKGFKVWRLATRGRVSWNPVQTYRNFQDPDMWERAKPSNIPNKPEWMTFDDAWVDEVRRGLTACAVFLWYPLYWLSYNQMLNNLTSQAATMTLNGVPNDIITNLNPITLIIFIPLLDRFLYPPLRKIGIVLTPVKRITIGFFLACFSMVAATIIQHYIYKLGPCGKSANECAAENIPAPISVWVQAVPYILGGVSEIFASVTSLEYAFTKAPKNMRSLVQAVALFMNAFSAALGQALVGLSTDPLLEWNYAVTAILAFVGGVGFWLTNKGTDKREDVMNNLPTAAFETRNDDIERKLAEN